MPDFRHRGCDARHVRTLPIGRRLLCAALPEPHDSGAGRMLLLRRGGVARLFEWR